MKSTRIKQVKDNNDKQETYRSLNKKIKETYKNNNYECILLLSYAMIEDRLLSLLHYLYVINRNNSKLVPEDYIDEMIRPILKFDEKAQKEKIYKINNIIIKIKIIKIFSKKNSNINPYFNDCFKIINTNIGINNLNNYIKELNNWIKIRNEIVHGSFNKNIEELKKNILEISTQGIKLSRKISNYVNRIKDNGNQISVRTKWEGIKKVFDKLYKEEITIQKLTDVDYLTNYDILCPDYFDFTGDVKDEFENLIGIIEGDYSKFWESKNDLNLIINDKLLRSNHAYITYINHLLLIATSYNYEISIDDLNKYIELDSKFKLTNNKKIELILNQLTVNNFGLDDLNSINNIKIIINYIQNNYLSYMRNFKDIEIESLLKEKEIYVIGISKDMILNNNLLNIIQQINNSTQNELIYDYTNILLGKENNSMIINNKNDDVELPF